jgi:DNA-binding transcriptional LysR family regulator
MAIIFRHPDDRLVRRLRLRDLHYVMAIAEQGSVAKAARALGITQPGISKAIADLEDMLGVRLFDRNTQGTSPTVYGQALLRRSQAVLDELKQGIGEIGFLADPTVGQVRIGCGESTAAGFLPAVIGSFVRQYPRVELVVEQTDVIPPNYHELYERKLDLMIGRIVRPFREDALKAEILFQERIFVIASAKGPWAKRRKIDLAEIVDGPWVRAQLDTPAGALHIGAFAAHGLVLPPPSVATFSMHVALDLVLHHGFLATVPGIMLNLCEDRGFKVLPVDLGIERRPMAVVTLKNRVPTPIIQRFIAHVRVAMKSLSVEPG